MTKITHNRAVTDMARHQVLPRTISADKKQGLPRNIVRNYYFRKVLARSVAVLSQQLGTNIGCAISIYLNEFK